MWRAGWKQGLLVSVVSSDALEGVRTRAGKEALQEGRRGLRPK